MHTSIKISLLLFGLVAIGAKIARTYGWYNDYWYFDIILHVISGIALGLFWFWLNRDSMIYPLTAYLSLIAFAVFGSFIWELWESAGSLLFPAKAVYYVPSLKDTLGDMASGMAGGAILALYDKIRR